ncbi:hypothetical protein Godav_005285 [Gossypium davidsonii]|uniref:Uncharacterized protein n=2 Tax=Gossypium TaxID=3633 RepID=A0A7J8TAA6_GOSDV|nr:hypothetical protein [Gossypium davidsonii]MBA0671353.1 hypothetical protein [Gossypium klotzschianum]
MAVASHQQGNNDLLKYISNSPFFFKTIFLDTIHNGKLNINQFEDDNSIKIIKDISPRTMTEEPKPNSAMETETECNGKSNGCQVRNGDKSTSHPIIQQFKSHVMTENPFFQVVMHPSCVGHSSDKKM